MISFLGDQNEDSVVELEDVMGGVIEVDARLNWEFWTQMVNHHHAIINPCIGVSSLFTINRLIKLWCFPLPILLVYIPNYTQLNWVFNICSVRRRNTFSLNRETSENISG